MAYKDPEQQKAYQRQWVAKRRTEYFADKRCATWWCGSTENLELDHIDPTQKVSHNIWSWSEKRRNAELVKCQVLCQRCHHEKTRNQFVVFVHGTDTMYEEHNCRCTECRQWKSDDNRKKKKKLRSGMV